MAVQKPTEANVLNCLLEKPYSEQLNRILAKPYPERLDDLIKLGYRCTSRKSGRISRIDDPEWTRKLSKAIMRPEAQLFENGRPSADWADMYRRCYSRDTLLIPVEHIRTFPGSGGEDIGYVDPKTFIEQIPTNELDRIRLSVDLIKQRIEAGHTATALELVNDLIYHIDAGTV